MSDRGTVTIDRDGERYQGTWIISKGMITVSSPGLGSKATQLGGSVGAPESLARIMLGELITDDELRQKQP